MMPRLVFVHGIGGLRDTARELTEWTGALAVGMRAAGHSSLAARLTTTNARTCSLAYYADLFVRPGAQGADDAVSGEQEGAILSGLLVEIVAALRAEHSEGSAHAGSGSQPDAAWQTRERVLAHAAAEAHTAGQAQGGLSVVRRALNVATTLMGLRPWGGVARWATPRLMVRDLAQVSRYLAREERDASGSTLDSRVRHRLRETIGDSPAVVVAHSLGTIVALETLYDCESRIPLLVTLGSPLSMRTVVRPRLVPQPPRTPESVERWLNFWDKDDIIAVRPRLEHDMCPNAAGVLPLSSRTDSDGIWTHSAAKYLAQAAVGGPVAEALTGAEQRSAP